MKIQRGGIFILNEDYVSTDDVLKRKRPVIVLNSEKNDSFFSAVRMGIFKSFRDNDNKIFIELKIQGVKYFSTILCDKVLEFPKSAIKEEIGTLDEKTIKIIENKLFHRNSNDVKYITYDNTVSKTEDVTEDNNEFSEERIVQADVTIKEQSEFEKIVIDTREIAVFLKESEIKWERERKQRKKYGWLGIIISNIASFILGVAASYTATHMDEEISNIIRNIELFLNSMK